MPFWCLEMCGEVGRLAAHQTNKVMAKYTLEGKTLEDFMAAFSGMLVNIQAQNAVIIATLPHLLSSTTGISEEDANTEINKQLEAAIVDAAHNFNNFIRNHQISTILHNNQP